MINRLRRISVSLLLCLAAGAHLGRAEDAPAFEQPLIDAGITPSIVYDGDAAAVPAGGQKRGSTYVSNLHVQITLDGERLVGVPGLSAYVDAMWLAGGQPSTFVGDTQGVSNIAGPPTLRLYEAWLQYNTPDNRYSILAGRYDLNTEFYRLRSAVLFMNGSFGVGPEFGHSGFGGPSVFPDTSLALRLEYKPIANAVVRFAVLDGAPVNAIGGSNGPFDPHNGVLLVAEAAFVTHGPDDEKPSSSRFLIGRNAGLPAYDDKIAVGAWYYTASFDDLAANGTGGPVPRHTGDGGGYLVIDKLLYQSSGDPKQRITGFVQLGLANQIVNRIGGYIGTGLAGVGLIPGRPDDEIGLAMAMARGSSHYIEGQEAIRAPVSAAETAIELTWATQPISWLTVQPDLQYVIHPNTDPLRRNAVVTQLRFEAKF